MEWVPTTGDELRCHLPHVTESSWEWALISSLKLTPHHRPAQIWPTIMHLFQPGIHFCGFILQVLYMFYYLTNPGD